MTPKPFFKSSFALATIAFLAATCTACAATITYNLDTAGNATSVDTRQPSLALKALVQTSGTFGTLGQITFLAGNVVPSGYLQAAGQLLNISSHQSLFPLFGTTYGGDGQTTFALPDLRSSVPATAKPGDADRPDARGARREQLAGACA